MQQYRPGPKKFIFILQNQNNKIVLGILTITILASFWTAVRPLSDEYSIPLLWILIASDIFCSFLIVLFFNKTKRTIARYFIKKHDNNSPPGDFSSPVSDHLDISFWRIFSLDDIIHYCRENRYVLAYLISMASLGIFAVRNFSRDSHASIAVRMAILSVVLGSLLIIVIANSIRWVRAWRGRSVDGNWQANNASLHSGDGVQNSIWRIDSIESFTNYCYENRYALVGVLSMANFSLYALYQSNYYPNYHTPAFTMYLLFGSLAIPITASVAFFKCATWTIRHYENKLKHRAVLVRLLSIAVFGGIICGCYIILQG